MKNTVSTDCFIWNVRWDNQSGGTRGGYSWVFGCLTSVPPSSSSLPVSIWGCACMLSCFSCVWLFATPQTVCSSPGSFVHGILQTRIPDWVAMCSSRGSSRPQGWTRLLNFFHWQASSLPLVPPGKLIFGVTPPLLPSTLPPGYIGHIPTWEVYLPAACLFCLFILSTGLPRQEYWSGLPFPPPVEDQMDLIFFRTLHYDPSILSGPT